MQILRVRSLSEAEGQLVDLAQRRVGSWFGQYSGFLQAHDSFVQACADALSEPDAAVAASAMRSRVASTLKHTLTEFSSYVDSCMRDLSATFGKDTDGPFGQFCTATRVLHSKSAGYQLATQLRNTMVHGSSSVLSGHVIADAAPGGLPPTRRFVLTISDAVLDAAARGELGWNAGVALTASRIARPVNALLVTSDLTTCATRLLAQHLAHYADEVSHVAEGLERLRLEVDAAVPGAATCVGAFRPRTERRSDGEYEVVEIDYVALPLSEYAAMSSVIRDTPRLVLDPQSPGGPVFHLAMPG